MKPSLPVIPSLATGIVGLITLNKDPRTHPSSDSGEVLGDIRTGKDVTGKVSTLSRLLNLTGKPVCG